MPFDPTVLQDIQPPDIAGGIAKGYQLRDLMDTQQLDGLRVKREKSTSEDAKKTRAIMAESDVTTDRGLAEAREKLNKAGQWQTAMEVGKYAQQVRSGEMAEREASLTYHHEIQSYMDDKIGDIVTRLGAYANATNANGTPRYDRPTIDAMATAEVVKATADVKNDDSLDVYTKKTLLEGVNRFMSGAAPGMPGSMQGQPGAQGGPTQPVTYDRLVQAYQASSAGRKQIKDALDSLSTRTNIANTQDEMRHRKVEESQGAQRIDLAKKNQGSATDLDVNAQAIAEYRQAPPPLSSRNPRGYQVMARVMELNPDYDANQYKARGRGEIAFGSGKQGDTVRSLNVAVQHLDVLEKLGGDLKTGDNRSANKFYNAVGKEFGAAGVTSFDAAKEVVGDEVVKAVIGSGAGGVSDRQGLQAKFDAANSPAQLAAVIATAKKLMSGQLKGLQRQYESSTGRKDFDEKLDPETRGALDSKGPSKVLRFDAQGNPVP